MVFKGLGREVVLDSTEKECPRCNGWGVAGRGYKKRNGDWQHISLTCSLCGGKKVVLKT